MEFYFLLKKNRITTCNTYKYDKTYNSIEEDPSDVIKKKKEYNIYGRIVLNFDDKHTIAHMGQSVQPEDTFIKK